MSHTLGPYEIRGELGRGAMAVVWRAWDTRLEREVAVKEPVVAPGTDADTEAELAARFVREGQAAAKLNHPGIVTIYGADIYDGRPAIVMELIEGETLAHVLAHRTLPGEAVLSILDQLLDAVGYAHSRGVVHRDIKPDNVFVTDDGRVKLTDFGIAHVGTGTALTQAGTLMGTPGYMAPEQITGQPVDARADLFSVGVIAYEMLSGQNPFGASDGVAPTTVMYRIVHESAPGIPAAVREVLPVDVAPAIVCALAKHPADRFSDAASFRSALRGAAVDIRVAGAVTHAGGPTVHRPGDASDSASAGTHQVSWIPYALLGVVAVVTLGILLVSAGGVTRGGAGPGVAGPMLTEEPSEREIEAPAESATLDVEMVVTPSSGEIELGEIVLAEVITSGDVSITEVILRVDGEERETRASAPYTFEITPAEPRDYRLEAVAIDSAGTEWAAAAMTVVVREDVERAIREVVDRWVNSFTALDLDAHMSCYGSAVSPYFNASSYTHTQVRDNKAPAFSKAYSLAEMYVENVQVTQTGADTAVAELDKSWDFISTSRFSGKVHQRLGFRKESGQWKIVSEAEDVIWVTRE